MKNNTFFSRRKLLQSGLIGGGLIGGELVGGLAAKSRSRWIKSAQAQGSPLTWTMVTSWPKGSPGPGTTAARIAETLTQLSGGRLIVQVFGAGELVPAFEVFDAVAGRTAELGHSASLFWGGKHPMTPLFTAAPFGLLPESHHAWILYGGGQALWDALYDGFAIKPFMAGNSGVQMGGWYRNQLHSLEDLKGLKIRMPGWGGEILRQLGATPVSIPPAEIFSALKSGVVDAAEYLGPWSDTSLGLHEAATNYYWPGFHEPNGTAELLVSKPAFESLPRDLQHLVEMVCLAESARGLAEADWWNAQRLARLQAQKKVHLRNFPDDILRSAKPAADDLLQELAGEDSLSQQILSSYRKAGAVLADWNEVGRKAHYSLPVL